MKKLLSLLIAICMVVGMIPGANAAGAEDYPVLEYNTDLTITCTYSGFSYVSFTPETDGMYRFGSDGTTDTVGVLCDSDMEMLVRSDDCYIEAHGHESVRGFCISAELEAGVTYFLGVMLWSESRADVTIRVGCDHTCTTEVIRKPTCSEEGVMRYTCTKCGEVFTSGMGMISCSYASAVTKEPTCTEDGVLTYTCTACGSSYDESIRALGHECGEDLICVRCGEQHPTYGTWTDEDGNSVDWVYVDGMLILTGEGEMPAPNAEYDDNWEIIGWYGIPWSALPITELVVGKGITEITSGSFADSAKLEKVTLPETITRIRSQAFENCASLTAVNFPEGLTYIGWSAFAGTALREVHLPASYTDYWEVYSAFYNIPTLERFTVAADNPELAADSQGALYTKDMTSLEILPFGFRGTYTLPASVKSVMLGMFDQCAYLEAIVVEEGNARYYSHDGMLYEAYYENLYDSESGEWVDTYLGEQLLCCPPAKELGSYRIEDWVSAVEDAAFDNCLSLTELTFPAGCVYLNLSSIGDGCPDLRHMWFEEGNPHYMSDDKGLVYNGEKYHEFEAGYFSEELLASFGVGGILCWVPNALTGYLEIPEGVKMVENGAISDTRLTAIRFPASLEQFFVYAISDYAGSIEWIQFTGEKPGTMSYDAGEDCILHNVNATVYYPGWLDSWADPELVSCGDEAPTYVAYEQGQGPVWGGEGNPFTDVPADSFYAEPVLWAVEKGITTGASENSFNPNGECLRAHVVTFLWRAEGCPEPESLSNPFVDVKESDFYFKAVLWAVEKGITNGSDATHFNPFGVCNRAQVVTFLHRAKGSPAPGRMELPFTDVPADAWYTAPIAWAVEKGITNGLSATAFGPNAACNRAQVVTFLYRAYH